MGLRAIYANASRVTRLRSWPSWNPSRRLMTLAIETSCDDTSVAIVEKEFEQGQVVARLYFDKKITSDNSSYGGVHPLEALKSHQENLAKLVNEAIAHLPRSSTAQGEEAGDHDLTCKRLPDFISVTRGPGMRSNLSTGIDVAKGLAVAWQVLLRSRSYLCGLTN